MRVYLGPPEVRELTPVDTPAQLERLAARVRRIAAQLDGATVIPLRKPTQPGVAPFVLRGTRVFAPVDLMSPSDSPEEGKSSRSALYVATPAVLRYLGIDPATVAAGTDFLVDRSVKTDDLDHPGHDEAGGGSPSRTSRRSSSGTTCSARTARKRRRRSSPSTVSAATAGTRSPPAGSSSRAGR